MAGELYRSTDPELVEERQRATISGIGGNAFINHYRVFLDCAPIEIGDDLQIGPAVQLYSAFHPLDRRARLSGLKSARPIRVGQGVTRPASSVA
jgi:acetyltransferase-like isoleucine patch superfamily enzyme